MRVVEVQLGIDERKPFSWVAYQAAQFCRLKVPAVLVVVTNDRKVAQWAAGPIWSGQTVLEPIVLGPGDVPAITDPAVAQGSIELTFVSGVVHGQDMIAVRLGSRWRTPSMPHPIMERARPRSAYWRRRIWRLFACGAWSPSIHVAPS